MDPPTLVIPLFQRLIHTINCQSSSFNAYDPSAQEWCRKEQKSQYRWAGARPLPPACWGKCHARA